jgi:hypothetical protein
MEETYLFLASPLRLETLDVLFVESSAILVKFSFMIA